MQDTNSTGNTALSDKGGTESGAVAAPGAEIPPDLAMVISAWPHLAEDDRKAVLAMIRTAAQDHDRGKDTSIARKVNHEDPVLLVVVFRD